MKGVVYVEPYAPGFAANVPCGRELGWLGGRDKPAKRETGALAVGS